MTLMFGGPEGLLQGRRRVQKPEGRGLKEKEGLYGGKVLLLGTAKIWRGQEGATAPTAHLVPSALGPSIIIYTELELRENQEK